MTTCWPYMLKGLCRGVRRDGPVAADALGVSALVPACCSKPTLAKISKDFAHVALEGCNTAAEASAA